MKQILIIIFGLLSYKVNACSFAHPFIEFKHSDEKLIIPEMPSFTVTSIERGRKGYSGSCAGAGILTIRAERFQPDTGYIFSLAEGEMEDQLFYPSTIQKVPGSEEPGEYFFIWLDGNTEAQEPIDIVIKITAVSKDGGRSEPQYLKVQHPGVKKAWWKFW